MAIYQKPKSGIIDSKFEKLPYFKLAIFSLFICFGVIILSLISRFFLPPKIPILFGLPQTDKQLAPSFFIILPSAIAILITIINALLAINIKSIFLKKALMFATISVSMLATITTLKVIFLVGSFL